MRRSLLTLAAVLLLSNCTPSQLYIQADRATYDVIAPEYLDYVDKDSTLDKDEKEDSRLTIDSWRQRLEAAEGKQTDVE